MRYRIAKRFSPRRFGLLWLVLAAVVGSAILISMVLHIPTVNTIIVPGLFLAVRWYMLSSTALMIDRSGVRVNVVGVPWESIAQLVVISPARRTPEAEVAVGLRLRSGATLPAGAKQPFHTGVPNAPEVYGLVRADKLSMSRLTARVHEFGPHVQVIETPAQADTTPAFP